MVIQECEDPQRASADSYSDFASNALWIGHNKNKGLGVFAKPGIKIEKLAWESNSLRYFLLVRINHTFDLVAVWACKPYIEAFYEYERHHHQNIDRNTVILGDFNSNVVWDRLHGQRNHTTATRLLQDASNPQNGTVFLSKRYGLRRSHLLAPLHRLSWLHLTSGGGISQWRP